MMREGGVSGNDEIDLPGITDFTYVPTQPTAPRVRVWTGAQLRGLRITLSPSGGSLAFSDETQAIGTHPHTCYGSDH